MNNPTVPISWDAVYDLVELGLSDTLEHFEADLHNKNRLAIFDQNREEDDRLIMEHIKALKLILKFYGVDFERS